MDSTLHECIRNFGPPPRTFSLWDRLSYFRVPKPLWLRANPSDKLQTHFKNLKALFQGGVVTWGHVIQANALLFQDGPDDCPGELVYSLASREHADPEYLQQVATELFSLKGTTPSDPDRQPIAHYLTDEYIRVFGLPVPSSISPSVDCKISTTYFLRKHLPLRRLRSPLLPIIVSEQTPHVVTPLPERYWPSDLIEWWQG